MRKKQVALRTCERKPVGCHRRACQSFNDVLKRSRAELAAGCRPAVGRLFEFLMQTIRSFKWYLWNSRFTPLIDEITRSAKGGAGVEGDFRLQRPCRSWSDQHAVCPAPGDGRGAGRPSRA